MPNSIRTRGEISKRMNAVRLLRNAVSHHHSIWHGNLYGASIALSSFYDGVDIHVMTAEADSGQSSVEQVRERLAELWSYLTANQTRLINYGKEYREGHRISTARVESTVDQLVDRRMEKKQAHALDPTRRADVAPRALCATQRRTGQIHPMVALRIIAGTGGGGMTPQVLSGLPLNETNHSLFSKSPNFVQRDNWKDESTAVSNCPHGYVEVATVVGSSFHPREEQSRVRILRKLIK